ncbi:MAG: hypothetical protein WC839_00980 [Candidatus Paceibacterota bacterium]
MPLEDKDKLNRIEDLKSKLFSKNYQTRIKYHDNFPHFENKDIKDSWEKEERKIGFMEKFFAKTTMFKKFFIFSIIFFILALSYASYMFFAKGNTVSNDNINISILGNTFTGGGEIYPLLLEIVNKNNSSLLLTDLIIEYPKSSETGLPEDNEHIRLSLGDIPAGGIKNENVKLILFGEQGTSRQIKISLEYRVEGSNAIFVTNKLFNVSINSTPINLSIDAPSTISSNQEITLGVKVTLDATKPVSSILLKVDYPIGFQFIKATPSPSLGNNIWNLGDLAPGAEHDISILGKMVDVFDGEEKVFRVSSGSQSTTNKSLIGVLFNSLERTVMVKKSSIEATLSINGVSQREYAIDTKSSIEGTILWRNNLDTNINNLEIRAKISGNAVDRNTIVAKQGFYDSAQNLIVWDKNSQNKFIEISPGESGQVSFSLSSLSLFSAANGIMSLPSINIDVSITGVEGQGSGTKLTNTESKVVKIISDVGFLTKALYYSGPFVNSGPIPPKVEQKTKYTIVWSLSNTANNISNVQIRSSIPSWIKFVGPFSPSTEDLVYNNSTKEIIWNVGTILKGTGITEADKEIFFQVELTPSLSQLNTIPVIINSATLTGHDDFANVDVKVNKTLLNTRLLSDPSFPANGGIVIQ